MSKDTFEKLRREGRIAEISLGPASNADPVLRGRRLSEWVEDLHSTSYAVEQRAVEGLSQLSTNELQELLKAIRPRDYPPDPIYDGKPLSKWLGDLDSHMDENTRRAAQQTIRQLGTNVIPLLVQTLNIKTSVFEEDLCQRTGIPIQRASFRRYAVIDAFRVLGNSAAPAIPELTKTLGDWDVGYYAANALTAIGTNSIPALLHTLTDSSPIARKNAAWVLGDFADDSELIILELTKCLKDESDSVRSRATGSLRVLSERNARLTNSPSQKAVFDK